VSSTHQRSPLTTGLDQRVQETDPAEGARKQESWLINMIDKADTMKQYQALIEGMNAGTVSVPGFLKALSNNAVIELAHLLHNGSEKVKMTAIQDILDRSGYGKTHKVSVGGKIEVDHETSRLELINMIMTSAGKLGLRGKDDEVVGQSPVIDVTPDSVSDGADSSGGTVEVQGQTQDSKKDD